MRARIVSSPTNGSLGVRLTGLVDSLDFTFLERARFIAFVAGCAALFWQYDGAAVDVLFGTGIALSFILLFRQRSRPAVSLPQSLLLVFLGITVLATVLAGGSPVALAITTYLIFFALAFDSAISHDPGRVRLIRPAIIFAAALTAIFVALGWLARQNGWDEFNWLTYDSFRSRGLFKDPNVAGGFLACTYPIVAAFAIRRGRAAYPILAIATLATGIGVAFTFSRMALAVFGLALVAVAIALFVLRQRTLLYASIASVLFAGAIAFAALVRIGLDDFPLWRYQIQAYDVAGRFVVWSFVDEMVEEAPLGTGAGSFERRAELYFSLERLERILAPRPGERLTLTPSAHNTYLRAVVETGIVGFLALSSYFAAVLVRGLRAMTAASWEWPVAFGLTLVSGLAIDTLHWRELWVLGGLISGAMIATQLRRRPASSDTAH